MRPLLLVSSPRSAHRGQLGLMAALEPSLIVRAFPANVGRAVTQSVTRPVPTVGAGHRDATQRGLVAGRHIAAVEASRSDSAPILRSLPTVPTCAESMIGQLYP